MKLNLGCGANKVEGFLNIDIVGDPDYKWNLEVVPWPFAEDGAVNEVIANHVLEHLGRDPVVFLAIIKELYRVCCDGAVLHITFPHHRHDNAVDDPTHVRQLTLYGLGLFDKDKNRKTRAEHHADSTLGLDLDVDFVMREPLFVLAEDVSKRMEAGLLTDAQIQEMITRQNNVVKEVHLDWIVRKGAA